MSKVDWSLAPEGATHYRNYTGMYNWYKKDSGVFYFFHEDDEWRASTIRIELPDLIERPVKSWSGEKDGLPPVGTVCECQVKAQANWVRCEIVAHKDRYAIGYVDENTVMLSAGIRFRAIKTPEQLAAEEREMALIDFRQVLDELSQDYCMHLTPHAIDWLATRLDRAGFKREVK